MFLFFLFSLFSFHSVSFLSLMYFVSFLLFLLPVYFISSVPPVSSLTIPPSSFRLNVAFFFSALDPSFSLFLHLILQRDWHLANQRSSRSSCRASTGPAERGEADEEEEEEELITFLGATSLTSEFQNWFQRIEFSSTHSQKHISFSTRPANLGFMLLLGRF